MTVEGLNVEYENMGGDGDFPGMMVKKELPLIVNTDIRLVDPSRSASCIPLEPSHHNFSTKYLHSLCKKKMTTFDFPKAILHLEKIFGY